MMVFPFLRIHLVQAAFRYGPGLITGLQPRALPCLGERRWVDKDNEIDPYVMKPVEGSFFLVLFGNHVHTFNVQAVIFLMLDLEIRLWGND